MLNLCKFFFLLFFVVASALGNDDLLIGNKFDYYILALSWPPTACSSECDQKVIKEIFLIHGLWPSLKNGKTPKCKEKAFNPKLISGKLQEDMETYWPALQSKDNMDFWKGQWDKHGVCSNMDQTEYFRKALDLRAAYNVDDALLSGGIIKGGSYTMEEIKKALNDYLPKPKKDSARIFCKRSGAKPNYTYELKEVLICFDKTPKDRVDCGKIVISSIEKCPKDKKIEYPKFKKSVENSMTMMSAEM